MLLLLFLALDFWIFKCGKKEDKIKRTFASLEEISLRSCPQRCHRTVLEIIVFMIILIRNPTHAFAMSCKQSHRLDALFRAKTSRLSFHTQVSLKFIAFLHALSL